MAQALSEVLLRQPHLRSPELAYRQQAYSWFKQLGLPHRRMDQWKYINSDFLMETRLYLHRHKSPFHLRSSDDEILLSYQGPPQSRNAAPPGLGLGHSELLDAESLAQESNVYALINAFTFERAWQLQLQQLRMPLRLCFHSRREEYLAPRIRITCAANSQNTIVLDWRQLGAGSYSNALLELELERGSQLTLIDCYHQDERPLQTTSLRFRLAEKAKLRATTLSCQPSFLIHDTRVDLAGLDASADLAGLGLLCDQQRLHLHTAVNHLVGPTGSQQLYKNILFDRAQAEYTGLVYAAPHADGTCSNQQNRNLLLSKWAHAIARPQLNINAEDLQCNHGSSTGSLAAEELFYLQSRGVAPVAARTLLTEGFSHEILARLAAGSSVYAPDFSDQISQALSREEAGT